jgi:hypothetical protein
MASTIDGGGVSMLHNLVNSNHVLLELMLELGLGGQDEEQREQGGSEKRVCKHHRSTSHSRAIRL